MFTISIFSNKQYFISLYLSLFQIPSKSVPALQQLIKRTKNPPISIIYTCEFLKQKSNQEYGLDIIRFVSQLSDLSDGTSVSNSLQNIIEESSLLTEVRHNLTHKAMVQGHVIQICRKIILSELKNKYWKPIFDNYCQVYCISEKLVIENYQKIYCKQMERQNLKNIMKFSTEQELKQSTIYKFKQSFLSYFDESNKGKIYELFINLSQYKRNIGFSLILKKFIKDHHNEEICNLLTNIIEAEIINLQDPIVQHKLKQLSFIHYIGFCKKVLSRLPQKTQEKLIKYWGDINISMKKKSNKQLYRLFSKN